ncbi:uncharacterized protein MYCFIDRAFT_178066 [Pseudocercospora fijiensis CIRAD86]|uniref:Uncharacterized protein n=1 Tax=Pseudocercospora fijiensis (strain CIRAD86) TaxID=383855 RepID=M3AQV3_PSEFD|nr:uncharacterized protein MYCFIDRAFT_178066 [Pseudocercospora fijiensis CIRAD86]EME79478.1 hypothetical protein MYCFIDRAFT_178066 [Pseudocercospora fijiensis CIRAD86]
MQKYRKVLFAQVAAAAVKRGRALVLWIVPAARPQKLGLGYMAKNSNDEVEFIKCCFMKTSIARVKRYQRESDDEWYQPTTPLNIQDLRYMPQDLEHNRPQHETQRHHVLASPDHAYFCASSPY